MFFVVYCIPLYLFVTSSFYQLLHDLTYEVLHQNLLQYYSEYAHEHLPLDMLSNYQIDTFSNQTEMQDSLTSLSHYANSTILHIRNQNNELIKQSAHLVKVQEQWRNLSDQISSEIAKTQRLEGQVQEEMGNIPTNFINQEEIKHVWDSLEQHHQKYQHIRSKYICLYYCSNNSLVSFRIPKGNW
jgi:hypothetical protein